MVCLIVCLIVCCLCDAWTVCATPSPGTSDTNPSSRRVYLHALTPSTSVVHRYFSIDHCCMYAATKGFTIVCIVNVHLYIIHDLSLYTKHQRLYLFLLLRI